MACGARSLLTVLACVLGTLAGEACRAEEPLAMRVESEVFVDDRPEPAARSLTLFDDHTTWDFLEPSTAADDDAAPAGREAGEIVLHDPVRERVIVVDPQRKLKTQIDTLRLERLSVSLGKWARSSDDKLVRWAGGPDFSDAITQRETGIDLAGPRARYVVDVSPAPSPAAAKAYRRFADTAILLKALLHPGGIPPFPRLAINRRIEADGGIPSVVTLEIDGRLPVLPTTGERLRSVHKVLPRLTDADRARIDAAAAIVSVAEEVDLAEFVGRRAAVRSSAPDS